MGMYSLIVNMHPLMVILLTILLIILVGFFVTSEFSLLRVRKTRLQKLYRSNQWGSKHLQKIMKDLNFYIISSQIGITITTLILGLVTQLYLIDVVFWKDTANDLPHEKPVILTIVALFLSLLLVTFIHSVIGEIAPKIVAIQRVENIALAIAPALYWTSMILKPLTVGFRKSAVILLKLLRIQTVQEVYSRVYSEDELKIIVAQSQEQGEIDESEEFLINRVLDFSDTRVNEIFTPRFEIVAFDLTTPVEEIINRAKETGYSRFPLYQETLDQVRGFVHVKDILIADHHNPKFQLESVMRPVFTIHEAMRLDFLLKKMQEDRSQVAIVVDEYGSVEGLVTIEDIIEVIVGPIDDEFDIGSVELVKKIGRNKYLVDGRVTLDVFNQAFQCNLTAEDSVTIAGFILEHLETVPREGSKLHHSGARAYFEFTVKQMDGNRVDKAQIMVRRKSGKEQLKDTQNQITSEQLTTKVNDE